MFESSFFLPLFAVFLLCLVPDSVIAAYPRPSCITFFFANGDAQSPPTSTVFRSTSTSTSSLPCGSCKLETQAFFPYPFYGYAAIDDAFTTTVTSPLGTSTSFVCATLTSSTQKGIEPSGTRPTGASDPASNSRKTASTRGPIVTGTANGPFTASGFRLSSGGFRSLSGGFGSSFIVDPSRARSSGGTANLGSITASRVSILTLSSSVKKNATTLRLPASSGIPKQQTCTTIDPAAPSADCITLSFISGNFTSCTSCPTDPADLALCPFLCSIPFRSGPIFQCSPTNLAGNSDIPRFAAASCQKCFPACDVTSIGGLPYYPSSLSFVSRLPSSSFVSRLPSSSLISRLPSSSLVSRLPSSSLVSQLPPSSLVSRLPASSLVYRLPASSLVSRLPSSSLVSRLPSSSLVSRLPSSSLISRLPASSLVSRLPASSLVYRLPSSSLVSRLPSSSLISRLPSSSLVSRLPSSALVSRLPSSSLVSRSPSFSQSSRRLLNPSIVSLSSLKATLTSSITSSGTRTSSEAEPSSSCPTVPAVVDHGDPCQIDFNDDLVCSACPVLFEVNIFACPFLCQVPFSYGLSALQCSQFDLTGQNVSSSLYGTVPSCQKCLTDCPAPQFIFSRPVVTSTTVTSATSASVAASTCSAVGASVTSSPFLITVDQVLYRESCGTSQAEVDACPFLCSGSPAQRFRRCAQTDESDTEFEGLDQFCERCLPPCEG